MDDVRPPSDARGPMTEDEARHLAEVALRSTKARGCDCSPTIGIQQEGVMGHPTAHIVHEDRCAIDRLGPVLVLGQPGGAEAN